MHADRVLGAAGIAMTYGLVWLMTIIGQKNALTFGSVLGDLLYAIARRMRAKVRHNLGLAFGDSISQTDADAVARDVLRNFGRNWAELFFVGGPRRGDALESIAIEGREHLEQALARGRGVIAVSAHLGNYPLVGTRLAREGYHFVMVVRDLPTGYGSIIYRKSRGLICLPSLATTPERQFFKEALRLLRDNGILGLIADENKRRGGIFVDFFGRPASTAPGPAALALRTGASLVPMFIVRNPDQTTQRLIIDQEIAWTRSNDDEQDMRAITAQYTQAIERHIRQNLAQWMWTNWRWRTQPAGQLPEAKLRKKKRMQSLKRWLQGRGQR